MYRRWGCAEISATALPLRRLAESKRDCSRVALFGDQLTDFCDKHLQHVASINVRQHNLASILVPIAIYNNDHQITYATSPALCTPRQHISLGTGLDLVAVLKLVPRNHLCPLASWTDIQPYTWYTHTCFTSRISKSPRAFETYMGWPQIPSRIACLETDEPSQQTKPTSDCGQQGAGADLGGQEGTECTRSWTW